jgi:nucleotide-binding universal stress UspA family protein
MFSKVIVGFDGSEQARDALMLGATLADRDGELIVCCVHRLKLLSARVEPAAPKLDRAEAERCLEDASYLLNGRMTFTGLSIPGVGAAMALQRTAEEQHADLLVLGSSHRGAVGRVLVGSVTEETLHGAPCPVAVAPVGWSRSLKDPRLAEIALAYDDDAQAGAALRLVGVLAAERDAHLRVLAIANTATPFVLGPAAGMAYLATIENRMKMTEDAVAAAIASLPDGVEASSDVRRGLPPEEILRTSQGVDLLVLGSHARGALGRVILGSVSDAVVRDAACPVLVVPSPKAPVAAEKEATPSTVGERHR